MFQICSAHSKNKQRPKTLHAATLQLYRTAQLRHAPHNCSKEESNLRSQMCCLLHPLLQYFTRVLCFAHITLLSMASVYYSPGLMLHARNMKTDEESIGLGICVLLNINICETDREQGTWMRVHAGKWGRERNRASRWLWSSREFHPRSNRGCTDFWTLARRQKRRFFP